MHTKMHFMITTTPSSSKKSNSEWKRNYKYAEIEHSSRTMHRRVTKINICSSDEMMRKIILSPKWKKNIAISQPLATSKSTRSKIILLKMMKTWIKNGIFIESDDEESCVKRSRGKNMCLERMKNGKFVS